MKILVCLGIHEKYSIFMVTGLKDLDLQDAKNPRFQSAGRWTFKQNSLHSRDICYNFGSTNFKDTQNSAMELNP